MKKIKLHIKCHNESDKTVQLRDLGLEDGPAYTEFRPLLLFIDHIIGAYPNTEGGCFVFVSNGEEITVKENLKTIEKLLNE